MTKLEINSATLSNREIMRKVLLIILSMLFVGTLICTVKAFSTPVKTNKKIVINTIKEKAEFELYANVKPSSLYPNGGDIKNTNVFFTKLINHLKLDLKLLVEAKKPVSLKGKSKVIMTLRAGQLWERNLPLIPDKDIDVTQRKIATIIDGVYVIDIQNILNLIDQVERETQVVSNDYSILIQPIVEAETMKSKTNINYAPEYSFNISKSKIELPTKNQSLKKQDEQSINIEESKLSVNFFNLGELKLPLTYARYGFLAATIIFLSLLVYQGWLLRKTFRKAEPTNEQDSINRKYCNRIIFASGKSLIENKDILIRTKTFKELLRIADEHDKQIIHISTNHDNCFSAAYYVIDNSVVYVYEPDSIKCTW